MSAHHPALEACGWCRGSKLVRSNFRLQPCPVCRGDAQRADFAATDGHTDGFVATPRPMAALDAPEGLRLVDTHRLCRHRALTDAEAAAVERLRRETVDRLADDRISARCWLLWAAVSVATLIASHYFPWAWGYGWQP